MSDTIMAYLLLLNRVAEQIAPHFQRLLKEIDTEDAAEGLMKRYEKTLSAEAKKIVDQVLTDRTNTPAQVERLRMLKVRQEKLSSGEVVSGPPLEPLPI